MVSQVPVMLRGRTAEQWSRPLRPLATILLAIALVFGASYFLTGATADTVPIWVLAIMALMGLTFALEMFFVFAVLFKAIRESKAGYTTTGRMYPELPQLDSETGEVVREAPQLNA